MQKSIYLAVSLALMIIVVSMAQTPAYAAGIWARVSGRVIGSPIRFNGWVNFSILTRRGKVTGKLNDGTNCRGKASINITISHGGGNIKCKNGLSAAFKFTLSSRFPIRGKGTGKLADGRRMSLKISPAE